MPDVTCICGECTKCVTRARVARFRSGEKRARLKPGPKPKGPNQGNVLMWMNHLDAMRPGDFFGLKAIAKDCEMSVQAVADMISKNPAYKVVLTGKNKTSGYMHLCPDHFEKLMQEYREAEGLV